MCIAITLKHNEAEYFLNYMKLFSEDEIKHHEGVNGLAKLKSDFMDCYNLVHVDGS